MYLGIAYYGDEIAVNRDAHPALTDMAAWTAAQSTSEDRRAPADRSRSRVGTRAAPAAAARLSGSRGGSKQRGDYQRRYKCIRRECSAKANVGADLLEQVTHERLRALPPMQEPGTDPIGPTVAARDELERLEQRLETWRLDEAQRDTLGADAHAAVAATYGQELEQARSRFEALVREALMVGRPDPGEIARASVAELPELLRRLGLRVVVTKGRGNLEERVTLKATEATS